MSNSYKLLGSFWDNLKESSTIYYLENSPYINDIDEEYNLFDYSGIRKINISMILKIESNKKINELLKKMSHYKSIIIIKDFIPTDNPIVKKFFIKRLKQIYCFFNSNLSNTTIYLSSEFKELIH